MSKEKAFELNVEVRRLVKNLPAEEEHVLSEELLRAAVDVATNIAKSELDDLAEEREKFLSAARGKVAVVETLLLICVRLNYFGEKEIEAAMNLCAELGKVLSKS